MKKPLPRRDFLRQTGATASVLVSAMALRPHSSSAADADRRVKVGQIGTAHSHAADKIGALRKLTDDFDFVGVVEPNAALRAQAERNPAYSGVAWMSEEQLLATPELKVVAIETGIPDLVPTAARCIAAGKHIHLDKPGGDSLAPFKQLLQDADERKLCVQMGYMLRHNPAIQFLLKAVRDGWLGQVFEIYATFGKTVGDEQRRKFAEYPGGGMFELGGHLIDLVVAVLGRPDEIRVFSHRSRAPSDSLLDNQLAVFRYPQCTATVRISLMDVDGGKRRQFVVCGSEGTVEIRPLEPSQLQLALSKPRESYRQGFQSVALPSASGRYDDQLKELARVARGEQQPSFASTHDLIVQECLLKASEMQKIELH